jgi:hypothetical protein
MIFKKLAVVLLATVFVSAVFAKDNLAVLPFIGGTAEEGETIAELFSFNRELNTVFAPIPRTSITRAVNSEQRFQRNTGMTDPDTIVALGRQLGAKYVVVGTIGKLGSQNLLIISILKIDDLRQVAGDIQTYVNIREIQGKLPSMARNIIEATKIDASQLDKLAVTPVDLGKNIDARVADILAQVLSINLIKTQKYAVYPRTKTLEQVQAEYKNQRSGITADENMVDIGKAENPHLVLSVAARRLEDQNMFNAAIISLESGVQEVGGSVNYNSLDDGIRVMERLARELTTTFLTSSLTESLAWISNNAIEGESYSIALKSNETIAPQTLSYNGKKVSIALDGGITERMVRLSTNGSLFTVGSGVTLTLGNNVTLQGRGDNTTSLVWVNNGGTLAMESGSKIRGNSNTASNSGGGGVFMYGTLTMNGGEISSNNAKWGSGVRIYEGGTFTQSGGTINGNSAEYGGGVYVGGNSTFTQNGGTINGNSAQYAGGVLVYSSGTFTQSGGAISGNSADYGGGGVLVYGSGTFTMSSGTISGNSASSGGGVRMESNAIFMLSDGAISGNSASSSGGGVYVSSGGTFLLINGTISGNTAKYGGGVFVGNSGTFTKQVGGNIYGSTASNTLKNTATDGNDYGHAVLVSSSPSKKRNNTAGSGVTLDSRVNGSAGGWE